MWKGLVIAALAAVAGCSSLGKTMDTWMGVHVDNLVANWGPPQAEYPLSDGGRVLQYSRVGNMTLPGVTSRVPQTTYSNGTVNAYGSGGYGTANYSGTSTTYVQQQAPNINVPLSCTVRITVNASGYISAWNSQGNNC